MLGSECKMSPCLVLSCCAVLGLGGIFRGGLSWGTYVLGGRVLGSYKWPFPLSTHHEVDSLGNMFYCHDVQPHCKSVINGAMDYGLTLRKE